MTITPILGRMDEDQAAARLGLRIRGIRTARGQTLADLAAVTGLTESFLSRLERGRTGVTLETLRKVTNAWGMDLVDVLQEATGPRPLVIRGDGSTSVTADLDANGRTRSETLITRAGSALQATRYRSARGGGRARPFAHPGEEFVYVVSGAVRYTVGETTHQLGAGDAIWHHSSEPHSWVTDTDDSVTIHVNTPPVW